MASPIPQPGSTPCEVLRISKPPNGFQKTVERIDPATGAAVPFYLLQDNDEKAIAVIQADPRAQIMNQALGTAKMHSLSSKIDIVFRGMSFKMKGNTLGTAHSFDYMGKSYSWSLPNLGISTSTIHLKDAYGTVLARWKKHPEGRLSFSDTDPTFEVYVPPQSIDMDMVVVTGLASVHYWSKEKKDALRATGEVTGEAVAAAVV